MLTADLGLCQGHQECLAEAPELFGFDDAGYHVVVRVPEPSAEQLPAARSAVRYCPAFALTLVDPDPAPDPAPDAKAVVEPETVPDSRTAPAPETVPETKNAPETKNVED